MSEVVKQGPTFFTEDFKELFMQMMAANPDERPTLSEIKRSKWFNGPVYDTNRLKEEMKKQLYMKNAESKELLKKKWKNDLILIEYLALWNN